MGAAASAMSGSAARLGALALLLGAASCGGASADFYVHDTGVLVETDAPFAHQPEFAARLESTLAVALSYWGGDWRNLAGSTITFSGEAHVACSGSDRSLGCYDGDIRVSTTDPGVGTVRCVEQTVLVHEVGHAVLGDRMHQDPRWMQLEPVRDALAGRIGYTADGEVECSIAVSVWRHPLGRP
jgi:hypothetical protein